MKKAILFILTLAFPLIANAQKKKIRNAAEKTVALLSFNCVPGGAQLSTAF